MEMIKTRSLTSHTYDESLAEKIFQFIVNEFYPAFNAFSAGFTRAIAQIRFMTIKFGLSEKVISKRNKLQHFSV